MLSLNIPSYALDYTTPRPSPLSSRNLNPCAQSLDQMKYFSKPTTRLSHSGNRGQAISPFQHIFAEQDRRRKDFLRKAQQARDDKKWLSRGDQVRRVIECNAHLLTTFYAWIDTSRGLCLAAEGMGTRTGQICPRNSHGS